MIYRIVKTLPDQSKLYLVARGWSSDIGAAITLPGLEQAKEWLIEAKKMPNNSDPITFEEGE